MTLRHVFYLMALVVAVILMLCVVGLLVVIAIMGHPWGLLCIPAGILIGAGIPWIGGKFVERSNRRHTM